MKRWFLIATVATIGVVLRGGVGSGFTAQAAPPGDPTPVPIPGFQVFPPVPGEFHVFGPGFLGENPNEEPTTLTDFRGFTALAYHAGTAKGSDGKSYDLFTDMRVSQGGYVSRDGTHHRGTFVLIWLDLFVPGTGTQVHDFNGQIKPLFWTVQIPDTALTMGGDGKVRLRALNVPIVDSFQFFGANEVPATASFDVTWTPVGAVRHLYPTSANPGGAFNFVADFRLATSEGSFSASNGGFSFTGTATSQAEGGFAEMGTERNGVFLSRRPGLF
jgi:hypothetical protein